MPTSFVYCTIYQQNIWREGDEALFEEQKRTWKNFFTFIENGYTTAKTKLSLSSHPDHKRDSIVTKFETLDFSRCWNANVRKAFVTVDQVTSNPKLVACKVYRKVQPYLTTKQENKTETSNSTLVPKTTV